MGICPICLRWPEWGLSMSPYDCQQVKPVTAKTDAPPRSFVILGLDPRIHAGTSGTNRSL